MCPFHSTGGYFGPTKRGGCHKIQCGARAAYQNQNQRVGYTAFGKSLFRGFIFVGIHASRMLFDYLGSHNRCQHCILDLAQPPKSRLGNNGSVAGAGRASNLLGTNSSVDLLDNSKQLDLLRLRVRSYAMRFFDLIVRPRAGEIYSHSTVLPN